MPQFLATSLNLQMNEEFIGPMMVEIRGKKFFSLTRMLARLICAWIQTIREFCLHPPGAFEEAPTHLKVVAQDLPYGKQPMVATHGKISQKMKGCRKESG